MVAFLRQMVIYSTTQKSQTLEEYALGHRKSKHLSWGVFADFLRSNNTTVPSKGPIDIRHYFEIK